MEKHLLDGQQAHWESTFSRRPDLFGEEPGRAAVEAAALFRPAGMTHIVELGAGQGRDTLFFAREGFCVTALDYSPSGLAAIREKAAARNLADAVTALRHDVRQTLPLADGSADACFSHMLFCMALTTTELAFLAAEIRRVLKPAGLCVYTTRHVGDAHCGSGRHVGENMYENDGFIVHFFDRDLVRTLAAGWKIRDITEFEEGALPRKLFRVTMEKTA